MPDYGEFFAATLDPCWATPGTGAPVAPSLESSLTSSGPPLYAIDVRPAAMLGMFDVKYSAPGSCGEIDGAKPTHQPPPIDRIVETFNRLRLVH